MCECINAYGRLEYVCGGGWFFILFFPLVDICSLAFDREL